MNWRILTTVAVLALLAACDKPPAPQPEPPKALPSVQDIEPPKNVGPPVDSANYDEGYNAGMTAGEAAARAVPLRTKAPGPDERSVFALEAAGQDPKRGPRWQRGYASGYKDGFERISLGAK